jgi:hypothetical protein
VLFAPELKTGLNRSPEAIDIFNFATVLWQILLIADKKSEFSLFLMPLLLPPSPPELAGLPTIIPS